MIKNIIFDIGNVLADFRWKEFLEDKGFCGEELQQIAKASVLTPVWAELDRGVWSFEQVMEGFVRNAPELRERLHAAFDDMTDIVRMRENTMEWIGELKQRGFSLYYLSNFSEKIERECEKALIFRAEMNGGILSWEDQLIKPDPAIYRLLLNRFGLEAEECVFFDDLPANVEAAKAQGIHGIVFQNRQQAMEELEQCISSQK